ncbi:hypothetical protein ACOI1H_21870 [Loktanella sp. DJP18]|uniref:hypothetical protein n=1 Tax=Loktanella sp. DJP18 TaxID=3409788 RepID=UPI003BB6CBE0
MTETAPKKNCFQLGEPLTFCLLLLGALLLAAVLAFGAGHLQARAEALESSLVASLVAAETDIKAQGDVTLFVNMSGEQVERAVTFGPLGNKFVLVCAQSADGTILPWYMKYQVARKISLLKVRDHDGALETLTSTCKEVLAEI